MTFQIHALPEEEFTSLHCMTGEQLKSVNAMRVTVESDPGYPCRISLEDAQVGERVILTNYLHQPHDTPFKASHAIYIRENAAQAFPDPGCIPTSITSRIISIRSYDSNNNLIGADIADGLALENVIPTVLENPMVSYLHLHNAKQGCYAARVTRL